MKPSWWQVGGWGGALFQLYVTTPPQQTVVLGVLMRSIGNKNTILLGLGFQILQLAWYGFGSQPW